MAISSLTSMWVQLTPIRFAQMSGSLTTVRNGVELLSWQFDSSSQTQIVEMRHFQNMAPYTLSTDIPTVVIEVYDPADANSMKRVADLLDKGRSTWLPQGSQLAMASSGGTTDSSRPVRRLKAQAKKQMGRIQVVDLLRPEFIISLLQWTLVVAATQKVTCPNPADHEKSVFESGTSGFWSKLFDRPRGTKSLRTMTSKVTLKSVTDSTGTQESGTQCAFLARPSESKGTVTRPSTAPDTRH